MKKVILFTLSLFVSIGLWAQSGTCGKNLTWTIEDNVLTISGTGAMDDFTWWESLGSVYSTTPWASYKFSHAIINEGVTSIGKSAFAGSSGLISVTIPNSVTSIGNSAFVYCRGLTTVTIPNSVTSIEWMAFAYCSGLTSVTIPNSVTSIGGYAFQDCSGLTSITIPNSVKSGFGSVFEYCNSIEAVNISCTDTTDFCNYVQRRDLGSSFHGGELSYSAHNIYIAGELQTEIIIPNSVTSIGGSAFDKCENLTSVTIPNSVTSIGEKAFKRCTNLISVTIGSNVESIGDEAFASNSCLAEIYSLSKMPPTGSESVFDTDTYKTTKLYVPNTNGALIRYLGAEMWRNFYNVEEIDLTGIETPAISPLPAERNYYNLQGQRSAAPARGLNIINGKKTLMH